MSVQHECVAYLLHIRQLLLLHFYCYCRVRLQALFALLDTDGDGIITPTEFEAGVALLNSHLVQCV